MNKITALEDQIELIQVKAYEDAERATKSYQETLAGGLPREVDFESKSTECPSPPGAEITLEEAAKFEAQEKELAAEETLEVLANYAEEEQALINTKAVKSQLKELLAEEKKEKEEEQEGQTKPLP